jgi:hypothetical protein
MQEMATTMAMVPRRYFYLINIGLVFCFTMMRWNRLAAAFVRVPFRSLFGGTALSHETHQHDGAALSLDTYMITPINPSANVFCSWLPL